MARAGLSRQTVCVESVTVNHLPAIRGANIETPVAGERLEDSALRVSGWIVPADAELQAVEVSVGRDVVGSSDAIRHRPDVATALAGCTWAGRSGFTVNAEVSGTDEIRIDAITAQAERIRVATLSFRPDKDNATATSDDGLDAAALLPRPDGAYDLSEVEALARLRSSPAVRWCSRVDADPPSGTAWQRITARAFFRPLVRPEFVIEEDDRVFTIGSCFARAVESALENLGMTVESRSRAFNEFSVIEGYLGGAESFTNKYTPESIRNELKWALTSGDGFPPEALVELPSGQWQDPHVHAILEPSDKESTLTRHRLLTDLTRQIGNCRVVVVTLGLIEAFYDTTTDLFTNVPPHLHAQPGRFRFRLLTFEQVMHALEDIHALLSNHGHPETEIVVTVSPVPLQATFTGQDVVLANTHSKSLLRAAAAEWVARHQNVHYFPSYEIVMNSDRSVVWMKDGRHVRNEFVRDIMDVFLEGHLSSSRDRQAIMVVDE